MIIVVTGLNLKAPWHCPRFVWHASRSFGQAQKSNGCLSAATRKVDGVYHTITAWRDGPAMKGFAKSGAHFEAEKVFAQIATGRVVIYQAEVVPDWDNALDIWKRDAREV
ncbi:MAG: hypothetical protein OXR62_15900 [Ahrensia sp.]|nr:hypothetical protein [Ahrensia sp.]